MDAALKAGAAREQAGDKGARAQGLAVVPEVADDLEPADLRRPLNEGPDFARQRLAGLFIGIQHQNPVARGLRQGAIARRGKVVDPVEAHHLGPKVAGNLHGVVGGTRVGHDDLIHHRPDTAQAAREAPGLVLNDHGQRQLNS